MSKLSSQFLTLSVLSLVMVLGASSSAIAAAADREVWYNAEGEPILAIDKKTGKKIDLEILKKEMLVAKASEEAKARAAKAQQEAKQVVEDEGAEKAQASSGALDAVVVPEIPLVLRHRGTEVENEFYWSPRDTYSGSNRISYGVNNRGYSNRYGYYYGGGSHYGGRGGFRVLPRFSTNGYYGPPQYVPTYPSHRHYGHGHYNGYGHGHGGSYHHGNSHKGGYLLKYSRPGLRIRAKF